METAPKVLTANRRIIFVIVAACLIIASPFALIALSQSDAFYYRHFHRIKARLEKLPDVKVVNSWKHEDITLEDFGFDLKVRACDPIRIDFYEGADWDRTFGRLDGFVFDTRYSYQQSRESKLISCEELAQAGLQVHSLSDLVAHLEHVMAYVYRRPWEKEESPLARPHWIRIYYDLKA